jgi:hypothetical protein
LGQYVLIRSLSLLGPDVQNIETSDKPEEQAPATTEGAVDVAPAGDLQTSSEDKPQETAADTVTEVPPQQQEGDATGASQETTRRIEVPNTKVQLVA